MANFSPYIRILNRENQELSLHVKSIRYMYDESLEDYTVIKAESDDPNYVDNIYIQENEYVYVIWGYIGEPNSKTTRKVYVIDSQAEFTDTGVILTLRCLPKTAYLKLNSKDVVRNNTDIPTAAKEMGDRLGITVDNQVDDVDGTSKIIQTGFAKPAEVVYDLYQNPDNPNDPRNGEIVQRGVTSASDSARVRRDYQWKVYESLPQGNRSDAEVLKGMQDIEPLDNLVLSGRDDKLTIKKRDFSQAPILTYVWKGGTGRLLKFKSGIKNTFNRSQSMLSSTDGWDPINKTFIRGDVKNTLEGSEMLADTLPVNIEDTLSSELPSYPGNVQYYGLFEEYNTEDDSGNKLFSAIKNDELNGNSKFVYREKKGYVPGKFSKDGYLLEQDVTSRIEVQGLIPVRYGKHNSSVEQNVRDIAGAAIPDRAEKTKELNKSFATALGDPLLVEGKIIRIDGVGKKYSGNWYIIKAEHIVDTNGWIVELEITKNARGSADQLILGTQSAYELNRSVNNQTIAQNDEFIIPSEIED